MGLGTILKKKEEHAQEKPALHLETPEFVFMRTDTTDQVEILQSIPQNHNSSNKDSSSPDTVFLSPTATEPSKTRRSLDFFRPRTRSRTVSASVQSHETSSAHANNNHAEDDTHRTSRPRRLSDVLHLSRGPASSESVPKNLPEIVVAGDKDTDESQWERRATMLAGQNELARSRPSSSHSSRPGSKHGSRPGSRQGNRPGSYSEPIPLSSDHAAAMRMQGMDQYQLGATADPRRVDRTDRMVSSKAIDDDIQEAIRLHEHGDLEMSTRMFGRLADVNGANNPLSQVLYGMALRHGWGCTPDPAEAVRHLTNAASNAASFEQQALQAGLKKGGAAKGELILAIFELGNCFRYGWGVEKDAVAAKHYYETAANLGDADAMNEVAWCYLQGYGCKKDKFTAARYYRQAEKAGNKILGNSWIYKPKYDTPGEETSSSSKGKK